MDFGYFVVLDLIFDLSWSLHFHRGGYSNVVPERRKVVRCEKVVCISGGRAWDMDFWVLYSTRPLMFHLCLHFHRGGDMNVVSERSCEKVVCISDSGRFFYGNSNSVWVVVGLLPFSRHVYDPWPAVITWRPPRLLVFHTRSWKILFIFFKFSAFPLALYVFKWYCQVCRLVFSGIFPSTCFDNSRRAEPALRPNSCFP